MIWLSLMIHRLSIWLGLIKRYGRAEFFTPDLKVGPYYIAELSAFMYAVFSDAAAEVGRMDISGDERSARFKFLRMQVVAFMLCDRQGYRLFDYNKESAVERLYQMPESLLNELIIQCADRAELRWVLPFDEFARRYPEALEQSQESDNRDQAEIDPENP